MEEIKAIVDGSLLKISWDRYQSNAVTSNQQALNIGLVVPANLKISQELLSELSQDKKPSQPWQLLDPISYKSLQGATLEKLSDLSIRAGGKNPNNDVYEIKATTNQINITAVKLEALLDEKQPAKNVGGDHKGNFVLTEFEAFITPTENPKAKPIQINRTNLSTYKRKNKFGF